MCRPSRSLAVVVAALAIAACKQEKKPAEAPPATTPAETAPAETPPPATAPADPSAAGAPSSPDADYVRFVSGHNPAKPTDPVIVTLAGFKVTRASFKDPKDLTGGTAELELDLTSLSSGNRTRDEDLKSQYFEVDKFGTARVGVHDVKKAGAEGHYKAVADLDVHGVKKKLPVEFDVVSTTADSVRVKGSVKLSRLDFKIGTPNGEGGNPTANEATVELQLTIKKS
jgi:polyisoprenoid-binding protein YceI